MGSMLLLPLLQLWQELLQSFLIADLIVVDEIDVTSVAERVKPVELGENLRRGLSAWQTSAQFDDVGKIRRSTGNRVSTERQCRDNVRGGAGQTGASGSWSRRPETWAR